MREELERRQIWIYFAGVALGGAVGAVWAGAEGLGALLNPAIALMLFATFLQVPLADLGRGFRDGRFMAALLVANFVAVPLLVLLLLRFGPEDPLARLGIVMVLLAPCIDYVVTFTGLGRGDARLTLAATPVLLAAQLALLPVFVALLLGGEAAKIVSAGPFLHAFVWLIAAPLALAGVVQRLARRGAAGRRAERALGLLPVPTTALVLFLVAAATTPLLGGARAQALSAVPVYLGFAVLAPALGWGVARAMRLGAGASRAVAFSAATRNSLVILPLALAAPGGFPVLPAVIVAQTLVELVAELVYIRVMPLMGRGADVTRDIGAR